MQDLSLSFCIDSVPIKQLPLITDDINAKESTRFYSVIT